MARSVLTRKSIVFYVFLVTSSVAPVRGGVERQAAKPDIPEIMKLSRRAMLAAEDRSALEAYEKRNTEITPWAEEAAPPNPDNAALLYYQAFLLRPEPNMAINEKIHDMFFDAEPDRQIRTYLGYCLPMIQMTEIASRIPQCTWGIWNGPGPGFGEKDLKSQVDYLWTVLLVDARTLAADGHYQAALEQCLTARRLARHLSEDPRLDLAASNPDFMALRTIQYVLGVMPPNADTLTWFRGELAVSQGLPTSFAVRLRADAKAGLRYLRTHASSLRYLKKVFADMAKDEQAKERVRHLTDDQFLSRTGEELERFVDSIVRVLDNGMTFEQKRDQMQELVNKQTEAKGAESIIKAILLSGMNMGVGEIEREYPFLVGHQAHINGVKAAVEVYLVLVKTGRLPEKLPDYLPKDPFTGRDFGYEITDEGFALRCAGKEFPRRKNLEFKVHK
ncbi:MAG TPA: hypothetical protein VMW24_18355 [Sedimentisphaerales bacterium]|nr:hypothetical protein [Sedimentisphaerales bacterium]